MAIVAIFELEIVAPTEKFWTATLIGGGADAKDRLTGREMPVVRLREGEPSAICGVRLEFFAAGVAAAEDDDVFALAILATGKGSRQSRFWERREETKNTDV